MAKIVPFRRIIKEDYPQKYQDLVDKLAYSLNYFIDSVSNSYNKNITIDNLSFQYNEIDVEVDSTGKPKTKTSFKVSNLLPVKGFVCIFSENKTNLTNYPTSTPFINYTNNGGDILVNSVTGLQPNNRYLLRFLTLN